MKKILNILYSTRLTAVLFILYATAMAVATFIENDFGTQTSKALVYSTWWFELSMKNSSQRYKRPDYTPALMLPATRIGLYLRKY